MSRLPNSPLPLHYSCKSIGCCSKNVVRIGLIKGISLPRCLTQQIINQYVDDTSFTMRVEEASVDNLVGVHWEFGFAYGLDMNWYQSVAYQCNHDNQPSLVEKYQW